MKWLKGRFKYAFEGLFYAFTKDASIRLQGIFGLIVFILAILFHCNLKEWLLIVLAVGLVWFAEIMNSCIERCVNYISLDRNIQAKHIKDMAAGAVFVMSVVACIIGLYIFLPKILGGF